MRLQILHKLVNLIRYCIQIGYYCIALYGLFLIIFWWSDDNPVIQFSQGSVDKLEAKSGEVVVFLQPITKFKQCPGQVDRFFSGECGLYHYPTNNTTLPIGEQVIILPLELPPTLISGNCQFNSNFSYDCNPVDYVFNRQFFVAPPIRFKVVKNG